MFDVTLTDNCQYQSQAVDTENICWWDERKNVLIIDWCMTFSTSVLLSSRSTDIGRGMITVLKTKKACI